MSMTMELCLGAVAVLVAMAFVPETGTFLEDRGAEGGMWWARMKRNGLPGRHHNVPHFDGTSALPIILLMPLCRSGYDLI